MKKGLGYREWLELIESIELRLCQVIAVNKELRRRNKIGDGRGYPKSSFGGSGRGSGVTDRTGTLAIMMPEQDPVLDAQLSIEKVLIQFDRAINVPLSQALTLPEMQPVKMKALGAYYARRGKR